jgi:phosphoribosylformimino-5-aminoimidazole carboxamide ribotide isomerase
MRLIPVLDLSKGQVVRGVAGRRRDYRPVVSRLTPSTEPLAVAREFRDHFGLTELYLADLDAIAGAPAALAVYDALHANGFRLCVDAGICLPDDAQTLARASVEGIVAGLETLRSPDALRALCADHGAGRIIFSLDLKGGRALGEVSTWDTADAWGIAVQAIDCGARRLIVLDLERVGVGAGTGTEVLCARLAADYPDVEVIAGGGVRGVEDLRRLKACGVRGVLVASALHDGRITRADLEAL